MDDKGGILNLILSALAIAAFLYVFYHFTEYEIEQQAKYEAEYCPPCKEKTNETSNE
jgi:DMSO/TMAO reductase YedYZ heme-binding membrane subunit